MDTLDDAAKNLLAFLEAADEGNLKSITKLIEDGVDVNGVDIMVSSRKLHAPRTCYAPLGAIGFSIQLLGACLALSPICPCLYMPIHHMQGIY